jgi:hypothetical protein
MAKRLAIPSKELALKIVGEWGSYLASRVQRINLNTDIPTTNIDEHGNSQHAGVITDIPNITLTFNAFDVGIRMFSVLTGTDPDTYPGAGVDISNLQEIDAVLLVKDPDVSDYVKSGHARRLQIRDFSFNYTVDGESTEEYTAIGSEKRWFSRDVVVDKFTTGTTSFTLSETPIQLKNGNYALSVILDGDYLEEVAAAPSTGEYSVSGTTLTTGDSRTAQVIAVYQANPAGNNWSDVSDSVQEVAIRGKDVKILISANEIQRVQSVTINGNMNPQPVREMGNDFIVGYQRQVPTIDGTITVLDTDTELIDLLTTGSIASGDTEFLIGTECPSGSVSLEVKLYDPCDDAVVVKTVYVPEFVVVGDAFTSNVNDNAQQTFNFQSNTAQVIVYSGARA